ncbi:hypothetical protein PENSPDRAFT_692115 [Peniophora sp. CONT]|nr:hypothetical protein PENSPDRAFT_692115 [Peniophora sp. CONT]
MASDSDGDSSDSMDARSRAFAAQRPGRLRRAEAFLERVRREHSVRTKQAVDARQHVCEARERANLLKPHKKLLYHILSEGSQPRFGGSLAMRKYRASLELQDAERVSKSADDEEKAACKRWKQASAYVQRLEEENSGDEEFPAGSFCCSDWETDATGETTYEEGKRPEPGETPRTTVMRHRKRHRAYHAREQMLEEDLTDDEHEVSEGSSGDENDSVEE